MATTETSNFKKVRLFKVSRELNVTVETLVEHLQETGYAEVLSGKGLNASITDEEAYLELREAFAEDIESATRLKELRAARNAELLQEEDEIVEEVEVAPVPVEEEVVEATQEETVPEEAPAEPIEAVTETETDVAEESITVEDEAPTAGAEDVEEPALIEEAEPASEEEAVQEAEEPVSAPVLEVEESVAEAEAISEEVAEEPAVVAAEVEESPAEEVSVEQTSGDTEEAVEEPEAVEEIEEAEESDEPDEEEEEAGLLTADRYQLRGTTVLGKVDLSQIEESKPKRKRKRKRKSTDGAEDKVVVAPVSRKKDKDSDDGDGGRSNKRKRKRKPKVDEEDVEQMLQETLRELEMGAARVRQRRRRERRERHAEDRERERQESAEQEQVLRVTEFVSTGELANLLRIPVNELISTLFSAGMMVSINQRLDADTIAFIAAEYDREVEFITEFGVDDIELEEDNPEDLENRAPVVTVMGHVDHGKTSLLDYIRSANVVAGESGGITQHIGAYQVELPDGRDISFLDTPGHEAFTAMRARGAKVTDVVILVVAANDSVMPQTIEAINHAKAAEVPIVVAINKIDLPEANIPKVMGELAEHNVLVEQYGGNVQCAQVSAKTGDGISDLLDKVLLEADLLELQGNPNRHAVGIIIEARLDKGRGNVATVLVQNGTLRVGDPFVAGIHSGRVRAMFDERDHRIEYVGPSEPALVLGFNGAPDVGDQFVGVDEESDARIIAQKRQQIHREQTIRQRKHVRLDDIGRRLALGDFNELNLILKGDVGGSVEALADSLLKISNEEVAVNIIHSGVGAITESDVLLASASDAVIIGFQVRPTAGARNAAEREEIDIRTYSIIYNAIEDVRDALEGMLSPEESEKILGNAEVREIFKVPKVGTVAGCYVSEGRIHRNDKVRLLRDAIVIYNGKLSSLKRFKDDVREVQSGYECGMGIENYNDIKVGDIIESYEIVETKRKLEI